MENELSHDELVQRARDKIELGEKLKKLINTNYSEIPGTTKMARKIQQEIKFLEKIIDTNTIKYNHITSSNLVHYEFLIKTLQVQRGVVHIDCVFPLESRENPLRVDIVADNGVKWIKVIARNPKSVADAAKGNLTFGARSVLDQAADYVEASCMNYCMFQRPKIVFYFCHQVEDSLREELHELGIQTATLDEPPDQTVTSTMTETLNLDITTMLAYISAVTNGSANWVFKEPLLTEQAEREREAPLKPILDKLFEGKRLICCQLAYDSFQSIVSLLAGPKESARAALLMERVEVLPNVSEIPEQLSSIQFTAKVNERSLKIFSFGMQMLAVTVTSNKAFVRSAKMQGINVPVFVHASRALTESKEFKGTPI